MKIKVEIKRLSGNEDIPLPFYATEEAAGVDLTAAVAETVQLDPKEYRLIPTGITIALPSGYEAQVRPRSGLAAKYGITVLNSPGTIDADYRGEIQVILINHSHQAFKITRGMRIAQMVIAPVTKATFIEVETLSETRRGEGGFGSTGH